MKRLISIVSLLLLTSCGYRLAGQNIFLPPNIKRIAVIPFVNETKRSEIEQRITESITKELTKRGKYRVISSRENSDAFLEGAISSFSTNPIQFNPEGRATVVEVSISVRAKLTDSADGNVIWNQEHFLYREQFDIPESEIDFFDQEIVAIERIAGSFARSLVTSLLEGF
ncbi:MAG: LPS assembly lipoprotein LptE [Acidobacteriota bacterium]